MKKKIILSVLVLLTVHCLLTTVPCLSAVPSLISYQGVLKDSAGVPQNGEFAMKFCIYNDSTGGDSLWCEINMAVQVKNGLFNVLLGNVTPIPDSVFYEPETWLQVQVGGSVLSPRRRIVSVGYAFTDGDWTIDGDNIYRQQGNVGIGTTEPQGKLDINGPLAVAGDVGTDGQFLKSQGPGANPLWSEVIAVPADNSVSQAKLKTSTGEVSGSGHHNNLILPGGEYGFYPQIKGSDISGPDEVDIAIANEAGNVTSYRTNICINQGSDIYIKQRYITSSGKDHWIFFLRDKVTKQILAGYQAPDHPCYGSGGDENDIPHPFGSYDSDKHEVILIDNEILPELKAKVTSKRSLLTVINEDYEIDFDSEPVYQPREIVEIDEYGDKEGEIIAKIKTPEWTKFLIGKDEIYLKRRLVKTLPSYICYKELKPKSDAIVESRIMSQK